MNKRGIATACAAVVFGTTASLPAEAETILDFTGAWDPATWNISIVGDPLVGSAGFVGSTQLDIVGGDIDPPTQEGCIGAAQGEPGPCQVRVTTSNVKGALFNFSWTFITNDLDGPAWDLFGILVDGNRIQLNDPNGDNTQTGTTGPINPLRSFGWYVNCADCLWGGANVSITAFSVDVSEIPEPVPAALLGLGLAAALGLRRKVAT